MQIRNLDEASLHIVNITADILCFHVLCALYAFLYFQIL